MVRTQIQITDEQASALKDISADEGVSMAALIRRSIDQYVHRRFSVQTDLRWQRALAMVGKYASNRSDVSVMHDQYLAESYGMVGE
jgi:hypothetical protein